MTLPYCATCSSPRLKQSPTTILSVKTPLPVFSLTLTLTVLHPPSPFLALVNRNFFILPRRALWDHPERKQTTLQTPTFSPQPTRRKVFQLRCRTSHQEFANWKNCLPMKYQLTHPSLRGSFPNVFSYLIKFASLNLAFQMLSFGNFPLKFVFDSAKVALPSSDPLIEPATSFSSPICRTHPHGYNFFIKFYP